ncbi:MAG: CDP-archaeol synthase [Porcipelethomonas sp.]
MILKMYITLMPCILAGVLNMLWCKTSLCRRIAKPMDRGKVMRDGRRIFGDNKTWAGFFGMIVCGAFSQALWGLVCLVPYMQSRNYIYIYNDNTLLFNVALGALTGFAYVVSELPNSFVKRRLSIPSGKTVSGIMGKMFFMIDQTDSLIGVMIVISLFYPMPLWQYMLYICLGAFTHVAVNAVLYSLKIRKNL